MEKFSQFILEDSKDAEPEAKPSRPKGKFDTSPSLPPEDLEIDPEEALRIQNEIDKIEFQAAKDAAKAHIDDHEANTKSARDAVVKKPHLRKTLKSLEKHGEKHGTAHPEYSGPVKGLSVTSEKKAKEVVSVLDAAKLDDEHKYGIARRQYHAAKSEYEKSNHPHKKVKYHAAANHYFDYLRKLSDVGSARDTIKEEKQADPITVICLTSSKGELADTVGKFGDACKRKNVTFYPILTQFAYIDDKEITRTHVTIENYDGTGKNITFNPQNTVCFVRGGVMNSFIGTAILTILENSGAFMVNDKAAMELCANKLATSIELDRHGVRTPRTAFVANKSSIDRAHEKIGGKYPVVIKTLTGAEGIGVCIVNTQESLKSVLQSLWKFNAEIIIQEYLEIKNDVRSLVLNGKVIAAAQRGKAPKDFRTNLALGAEGGPYNLSPEEIEIVEQAAKALGCYYVGVDSVLSDGKPYIIELNASPGSGNVYKSYIDGVKGNLQGQQLIDLLVDHVLDRKNWWVPSARAGLIETMHFEVGDQIVSLASKLDTGNESYNVLNADNITVNNDGSVSFEVEGVKVKKPLVSHVKIRTSNEHIQTRPVVEFDVKFRNRHFVNVRFSLTSRENNHYPVLLGLKFIQNAKLHINTDKYFELGEGLNNQFNILECFMNSEIPITLAEKLNTYKVSASKKIKSLIEMTDLDNWKQTSVLSSEIMKTDPTSEIAKELETASYQLIPNRNLDEDFSCFVEACIFEDIQNEVEDSFFLLSEDQVEMLKSLALDQKLEIQNSEIP